MPSSRSARLAPGELPLAESLKDNVARFLPYWHETIVPELIKRQPSSLPIRVWDAGCSTGEETYSIAMLFLEAIASAMPSPSASLALTCRPDAAMSIAFTIPISLGRRCVSTIV